MKRNAKPALEYLRPTTMDSILSVILDCSLCQHEAWSVTFVWIDDLSRRLQDQCLSLISIISFTTLICLFLTFGTSCNVLWKKVPDKGQTSECVRRVNECVISMQDTFNNWSIDCCCQITHTAWHFNCYITEGNDKKQWRFMERAGNNVLFPANSKSNEKTTTTSILELLHDKL